MSDIDKEWLDFATNLLPSERNSVQDLVRCLRTDVDEWRNPESTLVTENFAAEFRARLLTQHVFVGTPLVDLTFERAFIASMEAVGAGQIEKPGSTGRFWDCAVRGERFSLKSTKAKKLSPDKATISKLTEAAWIQDCRTASARRQHTRDLFSTYLANVQRLIQIRFFEQKSTYELLEIPLSLLRAVDNVPLNCFASEGPTIGIPVGRTPPDFTLVLDRSDAKITLRNIRVERCIVHARWTIGNPSA